MWAEDTRNFSAGRQRILRGEQEVSLLSIAAIVVGAAAVCGLIVVVLRRLAPDGFWRDTARAGGVLGAARSPFGVLMAFVVFVAFGSYNDGRTSTETEATSVQTLFETAAFFDERHRTNLQADLLCYARAVVNEEWPKMSHGERSGVVDDWVSHIEKDVVGVTIAEASETSALGEWFDEFNARERARDVRLANAKDAVPGPIWLLLGLGGLTLLAYVLSFADPREHLGSQLLMATSVTTVIVGGFLMIWFLSNPYEGGAGSIKPTSMQRTAELLEIERGRAGELGESCDERGRPQRD
jgi:hypothetical protein